MESDPEIIKKIDILNGCMKQLEEKIISKLRDISPIDSKNKSLKKQLSNQEILLNNFGNISKKLNNSQPNKDINFQNESQKFTNQDCNQNGCNNQNFQKNFNDSNLNWLTGNKPIMLTLGDNQCMNFQDSQNQYRSCFSQNSRGCFKCKF